MYRCSEFPVKCREYAGKGGIKMAKFQRGISGNPQGKKIGTLNKRTQLIKQFELHAEALINKTVELALSGDTVALRLCIERLVPRVTNQAASVVMPDLSAIEATKIIPALLHSLAGQELSVADMKGLIDIFSAHDEEIHKNNKKNEPLKITATDPIEAARQYQQFMRASHP